MTKLRIKSFKSLTNFDKAFLVGILLKGADGLSETLGGLFLFFVKPDDVNSLVHIFIQGNLNTNPHNFIATHILHWANKLTQSALYFGAIYLLAHGLSKLILVIEILRDHLWAYIGLIILTSIFIIYQIYEIIFSHSIILCLLTIFDFIVVYLTVREYIKQRNAKSLMSK